MFFDFHESPPQLDSFIEVFKDLLFDLPYFIFFFHFPTNAKLSFFFDIDGLFVLFEVVLWKRKAFVGIDPLKFGFELLYLLSQIIDDVLVLTYVNGY